jgi:hypothetical protein
MDAASYHDIRRSLRQLYVDDPRPGLAGFSGTQNANRTESNSK